MQSELEAIKKILLRERAARKAAEEVIERKSLELFLKNEELKALNESLEAKVEERTRQIEASNVALLAAKEKAERADRAKSDFLSTVSHEFRTPLNGIIGLAELMSREAHDDESVEKLKHIRNSGENLLHLINEILDFSKIEAGRITLEHAPFSFSELIESVRLSFAYRMTEKGLFFPIHIDSTIPDELIGDSHKLRQVLMNLVGNAIKFTEKGHVSLSVKKEQLTDGQVHLRISIADTGIGIPEEKHHLIFEAFEQAESSTTRMYGGTGLGLSIVQRFIHLMNGKITLTSRPGEGACFEVFIPLTLAPGLHTHPGGNREEPDFEAISKLSVLLVDDQPVNRFLMAQVFRKKNIPATLVEGGQQALQALSKGHFDLVLMDLHMPGMDGYTTVKKIRGGEGGDIHRNVYIIALTADVQEDTRQRVLENGMNDYLTKPIRVDEVYSKLQGAALALRKIQD